MANWNDPNMAASGFGTVGRTDAAVDAGLRSYMLSVYNYMGSGVLLTGIVAMLAYNSGFTASMIGSPLMWVAMLAPLAFVMVLSFGINKLSTTAAQAIFWAYAAVMGLSMSTIFLAFTRSEEHTSELQSLMRISYAVFCLKKKKTQYHQTYNKVNHILNSHHNSIH